MMLLLKHTKIIHIISVVLLIFSIVLSGFSVMKIVKLEEANKDFENKIKTLTKEANAVDNDNFILQKCITDLEDDDRVTYLEDDLNTLRTEFDDHSH